MSTVRFQPEEGQTPEAVFFIKDNAAKSQRDLSILVHLHLHRKRGVKIQNQLASFKLLWKVSCAFENQIVSPKAQFCQRKQADCLLVDRGLLWTVSRRQKKGGKKVTTAIQPFFHQWKKRRIWGRRRTSIPLWNVTYWPSSSSPPSGWTASLNSRSHGHIDQKQ